MNGQSYTGPKRVNKLGGVYLSGMPLPHETRIRILQLVQIGLRPSEISRRLRVTHGCVSKLLAQFSRTGCIDPDIKPKRNSVHQLTGAMANGTLDCWRFSHLNPETQFSFIQQDQQTSTTLPGTVSTGLTRTNTTLGNSKMAELIKEKFVHNTTATPTPRGNELDQLLKKGREDPGCVYTGKSGRTFFTGCIPERRRRTKFTANHLGLLEKEFANNSYIGRNRKKELAQKIGVPEHKIQVWFCNRRANTRRRLCKGSSQQEPVNQDEPTVPTCACVESVEFSNSFIPSFQNLYGMYSPWSYNKQM